jgi:hypothetical protein
LLLRKNGSLLLLLALSGQVSAGEIPGLPASLPTFIERDFQMVLSNDFFGSGGSVDDFRTQQIVLAFKPAPRWSVLLDHSVLTFYDPRAPGRTDQLSASFGYDLIHRDDAGQNLRLTVGTGLRRSGELAGQRIQNGFHRIIDNSLVLRPYTGIGRTDATAWADAEQYFGLSEINNEWRLGAWWRANSLVTTDTQWDGSAALYAVASRRALDLWLGVRTDWRSGYDDPVLRETAAAEEDTAIVFGVRYGALVIETVQQLNNDASYGQVRLVTSGKRTRSSSPPRVGIEAGFLIPNVQVHVAARTPTVFIARESNGWRESAFVSLDYGEPQHRDSPLVFIRSKQIGLGLEWEHPLGSADSWLAAYTSAGAGYRTEQLIGDAELAAQRSASSDSAVLLGGAGVRMDTTRLGGQWNLRIQLGLSGRLPLSDAERVIGTMTMPVQVAAVELMLGMTFDFE